MASDRSLTAGPPPRQVADAVMFYEHNNPSDVHQARTRARVFPDVSGDIPGVHLHWGEGQTVEDVTRSLQEQLRSQMAAKQASRARR